MERRGQARTTFDAPFLPAPFAQTTPASPRLAVTAGPKLKAPATVVVPFIPPRLGHLFHVSPAFRVAPVRQGRGPKLAVAAPAAAAAHDILVGVVSVCAARRV
jgi:hypothetical protein